MNEGVQASFLLKGCVVVTAQMSSSRASGRVRAGVA